ncbi:MAG: hypothetical protein IKE74_10910 [Mogibacterium sp.]|nr:hypothetical protein [Mogibacterium sp.]
MMNCMNCYYGNIIYDTDGSIIGVDCAKDNMRFVNLDIAQTMHCGAWSERDE